MKNNHIINILIKNKIDAALVTSAANITYLTGYNSFSQVEREAYLLISEKKHHLITDGRYINALKYLSKNFRLHEITPSHTLTSILKEITISEEINSLGFESDNLTVSEYIIVKKIKTKLTGISLRELRLIKSEIEIEKIKKSCDIANIALKCVMKKIKPDMSEKDISFQLELEIKKVGAELSFPTIVAFGKNAATPHHTSSDTKLNKNNLILIDFGVKYDNFCSDMTRTFFMGIPTVQQQRIYEVVKKSQLVAINFISSNLSNNKSIKALDVDKVARDYIVSQGYPTIPHSLGHGIGIEVHEPPRIGSKSNDILIEGMVFSIEPGIYLPGVSGVRIEDLFTIIDNQIVKLT